MHGPFVIVHLNVYSLPATPVKSEVRLDALLNEPPVPETTLHCPVPLVGLFAESATVVNPQVDAPV